MQKPFLFMPGTQAVYSCGREALFHGIKLLGYLPQKVHMPAYCCRSVLSPFEKLGIAVRFYDVDERLKPVYEKIEFTTGDVFIAIHYFGIPQDVIFINQLCKETGLVFIEDCAHTLPDPEAKRTAGSTGAFSIFSLRKHFPVPDGGVLVINDQQLKERLISLSSPELRGTTLKRWLVSFLDRFSFTFGFPNTLVLKDMLRDKIGSGDNTFYKHLADNTAAEISPVTAQVLSRINIGAVIKIRRENYKYIAERLSGLQRVAVPFPSLTDGAVPLAFPILMENAERVCKLMRKKGVGAGRWPDYELPESLHLSDFPGTSRWINSLVLLPLHQDLNAARLDRVVETLKKAIANV